MFMSIVVPINYSSFRSNFIGQSYLVIVHLINVPFDQHSYTCSSRTRYCSLAYWCIFGKKSRTWVFFEAMLACSHGVKTCLGRTCGAPAQKQQFISICSSFQTKYFHLNFCANEDEFEEYGT
jgi:hypothetical protein